MTVARPQDVIGVVVGLGGLAGLASVLLGSVSEGIVRRAHRTAVVVRESAAAAARAREGA